MSLESEVLELRERMRAWIAHEGESTRRSLVETWAQPIPERVESGSCLEGLRFLGVEGRGEILRFEAPSFLAKFREGEALYLGDGERVEEGFPCTFESFDPGTGEVRISPDRFDRRDPPVLTAERTYCLDRRGLGLEALLLEGLSQLFQPGREAWVETLLGRFPREPDPAREREARKCLGESEFTEAQGEAFVRAVGGEGVTLVQGPPGTGKTRVLAEIAVHLAKRRARVFVTGYTHRAIQNVLLAIRRREPGLPLFKLGRRAEDEGLRARGIRLAPSLNRLKLPPGGVVVGGTPFALRRCPKEPRFHFLLMDEAGQMPVVHGAIAMLVARRHVLVGDPAQLSPVRVGDRHDPSLGDSLFLRMQRYVEPILLDLSFRLNDGLVSVVSREFYGGRLRAAPEAAGRRLPWNPGGRHDPILDPERPLVWARFDHRGRRRRSPEETALLVALVGELRGRHGLPPGEIAVLSPYRAQVRAIRHALEKEGLHDPNLVVDTVERLQGQERECLLLSLACSDRDVCERRAEFFYDPGRLNVALSRARTKCVVAASTEALRGRPRDLDLLLAAARLKRILRAASAVDCGTGRDAASRGASGAVARSGS